MGFFGGLIKGVAKIAAGVAKTGLSVATRGVSDKVFKVVKGLGGSKKTAVQKAGGIRTNQQEALANKIGVLTPRTINTTYDTSGTTRRKKKRKAAAAPRLALVKTTKTKTTGAKRKPPAGGLWLEKMSAEWKAAGKPTSWQQWIKSNPIRRPA